MARGSLLARIRAIPAYMGDREVPMFRKALVFLVVIYAISPLDAMPDVIPFLGWLDDIGALGLIVGALLRDIDHRGLATRRDPLVGS